MQSSLIGTLTPKDFAAIERITGECIAHEKVPALTRLAAPLAF